jgi:hypothetical protein
VVTLLRVAIPAHPDHDAITVLVEAIVYVNVLPPERAKVPPQRGKRVPMPLCSPAVGDGVGKHQDETLSSSTRHATQMQLSS